GALVVGTPVVLSFGATHGDLAADGIVADGPLASDDVSRPAVPTGSAGVDGAPSGHCPPPPDLVDQSAAVRAGQADDPVRLPLKRVTLCRYRHADPNWSIGSATRRAGPRDGTPGQFGAPVRQYLEQRIWRSPSLSPTANPTPDPTAS